jgi:hypothetical protein
MSREELMPRSRVEQLVVQEMSDETLVYDLDRHKAHCLNRAAATVWRHCDGRTSVREMAEILHRESSDLPASESVVWVALDQLGKARLLDAPVVPPAALANAGRRAALKRIGLVGGAAALLPVITSIVAPTPAAAATCRPSNAACTSSAQCCSGLCNAMHCA